MATTFPDLEQNETIEAAKRHYYLRIAGDAFTAYTKVAVEELLTLAGNPCSYIKNVEAGATLEEAIGQTINNALGQQIVLDSTISSSMNLLGLTGKDYRELRSGTNNVQNVNLDIIKINAPVNRTVNEVEDGDQITVIYGMKTVVTLSENDGQPDRVTLTFSKTDAPSDTSIDKFTVGETV